MKPSSVITLTRGRDDALELFWSRRHPDMAFLGGFWAFAGGSVEPGDSEIPLSGDPPEGFPGGEFYGCAAREAFEELGLLVTTSGLQHVSCDPALAAQRDELGETGDFAQFLRERGEAVDVERFLPTGRWHTPPWFDIPFDSEFFAVALTPEENDQFGDALAEHLLAEELVAAEWTSPAAALRRWRNAERYLTLPIRKHIESLHAASHAREVDVHSVDVAFHYEEWLAVPGVYMVPLKSPTIPPATHTNCLIVGDERFVVIDPGSPYGDQQEGMRTLVRQMMSDGKVFEAILLTHHHVDHVAGVSDLVEQFGCPVWAHPHTAAQVDFGVERTLTDDEVIELDDDSLRCVFTPGHASGHLCFYHARTDALFGGDLIASNGTILINPPDGHMGDYLASLARIRDLAPHAIYPAHGWIVTNPVERLQFYIDHRLAREDKILVALQRFGRPASAGDLVPDAYADAPRAVWPIAARSAEAHLIHLVEIGRAASTGNMRYEAV